MLNDGGSISTDTGEFIFREFDEKIGFSKTLAQHLKIMDTRAYFVHTNKNLLRQKIYKMITGYSEDAAADQLTKDPVFTQIIGTPALASQPSLSRFFKRFDKRDLHNIVHDLQEKSIGIVFIKEQIDFATPVGKLMFTMLGAIAEFERVFD